MHIIEQEKKKELKKKQIELDFLDANSVRYKRSHLLYYVWGSMKRRCYSPRHHKYSLYGAIGVTIYNEWLSDYLSFREWAITKGGGYKEGLSIDKDELCIVLDIHPHIYSPSTCQFITVSKNTKLTKCKTKQDIIKLNETLHL